MPTAVADPEQQTPDEKALAGMLVLLFACSIVYAALLPMNDWDELLNWGYRGHLEFHEGPTTKMIADYRDFSPRHQAYPHGLPLIEAFAAHAMGRWDDARVQLAFPLFYGSLGLLVFAALRPTVPRRLSLLFTLLAMTAPSALLYCHKGWADLPMASLFLGSILCVERFTGEGDFGYLLCAGLCSAIMSWTKVEGGALKLLVIVLALARAIAIARRKPVVRVATYRAILLMLALAFLPLLPWDIAYRRLGLHDWVVNAATLSPSYLGSKLWLAPFILRSLFGDLFTGQGGGSLWNATYVMLALLAVTCPTLFFARGQRLLGVALLLGMLGYASIYLVSPRGLLQMDESFDRILLHVYPLAIVLAARVYAASNAATECGKMRA